MEELTNVLTSDNWILTVGTFLPLLGVLFLMFLPASEERLHMQIAIVASGATIVIGIWTLAIF